MHDRLEIGNYHPISVLPCLSKISKCILIYYGFCLKNSQRRACRSLENIMAVKMYSHLLWKKQTTLDNKWCSTNRPYPPKALAGLPYRLLMWKLHASSSHVGLSSQLCEKCQFYFTERQQKVRIGNHRSSWLTIMKGAPQGSVMGPFLFKVFLNDLVNYLEDKYDIYITMLMITLQGPQPAR